MQCDIKFRDKSSAKSSDIIVKDKIDICLGMPNSTRDNFNLTTITARGLIIIMAHNDEERS